MPDRIAEIRARLDAATAGPWERHPSEPWVYVRRGRFTLNIIATQLRSGRPGDADLIAHAPADIAWLLDEVERVSRFHAPATTALPHDDSVVQGVTKLECSDG